MDGGRRRLDELCRRAFLKWGLARLEKALEKEGA